VFDHLRFKHPSIAVVTDNQGILGIGDQGVGGIDIPIGKLALYVLGTGIRPWETLPLTLDVGTDNPRDLKDPYYLGYKSGRLKGNGYDLDRYRHKVLSFNDDIQGTGSVALAGILNALRRFRGELKDQRFVIYGSGAGGIGIARQIAASLELKCNLTREQALDRIAVLDSRGLVTDQRAVEDYKKSFSKGRNVCKSWGVDDLSNIVLLEVIKNFRPTVPKQLLLLVHRLNHSNIMVKPLQLVREIISLFSQVLDLARSSAEQITSVIQCLPKLPTAYQILHQTISFPEESSILHLHKYERSVHTSPL
jgi:hypothetical protein